MIEKLRICGFRKYTELKLDDLGQINIVLGNNNIGKTSILEAVYTFACGRNVVPLFNVPLARARYTPIQNRYWIMEEILAAVNNRKEIPLKFSFEGIVDGNSACFNHEIYPSDVLTEYDSSYKMIDQVGLHQNNDYTENSNEERNKSLEIRLPNPMFYTVARWLVKGNDGENETIVTSPLSGTNGVQSFLPARYIDLLSHSVIAENAQVYAMLKREGIIDDVIKKMQRVYPEISGFDMIPYPDGSQAPISVVKNDGSILPLYALGDGIQRWFYILGVLELSKKSIVCIDEVDTGFHPESQEEFCENLIKHTFDNGIQLFITTHNIEFMDNFLKATRSVDENRRKQIRVLSMDKGENGVDVRVLNSNEAIDARVKYNLELRKI